MSFWFNNIVDIQDKLMGVANSAPPDFMDFVACWMAKISGYDRKAYSHLGYVNKFAGSPVHWQDPALRQSSPPGDQFACHPAILVER